MGSAAALVTHAITSHVPVGARHGCHAGTRRVCPPAWQHRTPSQQTNAKRAVSAASLHRSWIPTPRPAPSDSHPDFPLTRCASPSLTLRDSKSPAANTASTEATTPTGHLSADYSTRPTSASPHVHSMSAANFRVVRSVPPDGVWLWHPEHRPSQTPAVPVRDAR